MNHPWSRKGATYWKCDMSDNLSIVEQSALSAPRTSPLTRTPLAPFSATELRMWRPQLVIINPFLLSCYSLALCPPCTINCPSTLAPWKQLINHLSGNGEWQETNMFYGIGRRASQLTLALLVGSGVSRSHQLLLLQVQSGTWDTNKK